MGPPGEAATAKQKRLSAPVTVQAPRTATFDWLVDVRYSCACNGGFSWGNGASLGLTAPKGDEVCDCCHRNHCCYCVRCLFALRPACRSGGARCWCEGGRPPWHWTAPCAQGRPSLPSRPVAERYGELLDGDWAAEELVEPPPLWHRRSAIGEGSGHEVSAELRRRGNRKGDKGDGKGKQP